jgi:hypothetical protein
MLQLCPHTSHDCRFTSPPRAAEPSYSDVSQYFDGNDVTSAENDIILNVK